MTTDLPELPEMPDEVYISDPAQIEALSSPFRMRILKAARAPVSVRELAEVLGVPVTRLYYHVNLLEEAGFLTVVHVRKSGARLEKLYRVAGKSITPGPELAASVGDPEETAKAMTAIVFEPARIDVEAALTRRLAGDDITLEISALAAVLSPEEAIEIRERMRSLMEELLEERHESDHPEAATYTFMYALTPVEYA